MPTDCLRNLRLLCEDFPRSHNLVLIGQPPLMQSLTLSINEEIRSRVTYSALLPRLNPLHVASYGVSVAKILPSLAKNQLTTRARQLGHKLRYHRSFSAETMRCQFGKKYDVNLDRNS
jgi:hypothetical protein